MPCEDTVWPQAVWPLLVPETVIYLYITQFSTMLSQPGCFPQVRQTQEGAHHRRSACG
jgi:hypothetical protein